MAKGVTKEEIIKALREELGFEYVGGQQISSGVDLNAFWFGRYNVFGEAYQRLIDANAFLPVRTLGGREAQFVGQYNALYSKRQFAYGQYVFRVQLPLTTELSRGTIYLGAESTGSAIGGIADFIFPISGINSLSLAPCPYYAGIRTFDITGITGVPDPATALHDWTVKINRASVEYWVDGILIGIIQAVQGADVYNVRTTDPYVLAQTSGRLPTHLPVLFEAVCSAVGYVGVKPGLILDNISITDGDPAPPRTLHPITGGVNWKGLVSNPSTVSDGIPIAGYKHKTVYFIADEAGTLDISIDYGDNSYNSITPTPLTVTANQLLTYPTENDGLWMRLTFTPTAPPATITRARVMMSD